MDELLKARILKYDAQVPRYTSYPTAPHFVEGMEEGVYDQWIDALPDNARLSLYMHVPFCPRMCWYCGCHTKITQRYAPVEDYAHLMMREIDMLGTRVKAGQRVTHVHLGGGSPSMLLPVDFQRIMDRIRAQFTLADDAEIAMEVDPRGVTMDHVKAYVAAGLNRVSLGVQDFDMKVLEAVNRPQPYELSADVVRFFRENGVEDINFDFLYGLPYQTIDTMLSTINKAMVLGPKRISLFGYAHVPWMKKHMQLIDVDTLPDKSLRYDLFEIASEILAEHGYVRIGIDHFAKADDDLVTAQKNGTLHRNFQGYTTDTADALIGIGSSSIGKFPQGFAQNSPHMPIYKEHVLAGRLSVAKFCTFSAEDKLRADVIEQLMSVFRADVPAICKQHGFDAVHLNECFSKLQDFISDGLVSVTDKGVVTIDPRAPQIPRLVAAAFDAYLVKAQADAPPRHSRAI